jgi:hypothetical protein
MIQGVSRDAEYIVQQIAARSERKVPDSTQGKRQEQRVSIPARE